ncbi:hypothetical protein RI129_013120 [Pyrocoelia pectoralis]|uniref:Phospholipid scramblase n=1 Tax=Pyrocoelia pectoralis TaxID=417401 RepID=A0AAN7Z7D5_9COLE
MDINITQGKGPSTTVDGSGKPVETVPLQAPYGPPQVGYGGYPPPQNHGNFPPPGPTITSQPQSNYGPLQPGSFPPPTNGTHGGENYGPHPPQPMFPPGQGGAPMIPSGPFPPPGQGGASMNPSGPPGGNWMMRPQNVPNCPPGLEYLTLVDTLIVNQIFNMEEALASQREPENQFIITNNIGQNVYFAREESDDCSRQFCGSRRAFRMKIFDNYGNQVVQISRPIACQACCFPCCLQKMEVSAPPGTVVGLIDQEWSLLYPTFMIKTPTGETVLQMKGPMCTMNCYADVEFKIFTPDGTNEVGRISKKWSGYASENSAKTDVFGISFPMDLDVRMKAVMLGACFLIDMMYFEQNVSRPNTTNQTSAQHNAPQRQEMKPI